MKIRIMMLFLAVSIASPFVAIAHGAETHGKAHKAKRADKESVTILDMSGPDKPESALPEITSKGKL